MRASVAATCFHFTSFGLKFCTGEKPCLSWKVCVSNKNTRAIQQRMGCDYHLHKTHFHDYRLVYLFPPEWKMACHPVS